MRLLTGRLATVTLTLGVAYTALAQAPLPPPGVAPPPEYDTHAAPIASGRVKRFLVNPNGEVDGLMLEDGTQVNLAPHLSVALLQMAKPGDLVSVQGLRGPAGGAVHASSITNTATKRSLVDQPASPDRLPPSAPALKAMNAEGRIVQLLHADLGELDGALLDDGTIVRWPPPFGAQLQSLLQDHASVKASGYGSENAYGRAFEATSVAVNGASPIAIYGRAMPAPPAPGRRPPAP